MANEITYTARIKVINGLHSFDRNITGTLDQSGKGKSDTIALVATTPTLVYLDASVVHPGIAIFRNLDSTNAVQITFDTDDEYDTQYPIRIPPGTPAIIPLNTLHFFARAENAPVYLEVACHER